MDAERFQEIRRQLLADREQRRAEVKKYRIELFNNLKPFESEDDIPDIPIMDTPEEYEEVVVRNLIRCGAIPKDRLEVGARYLGTCRNFNTAVWNGTEFEGRRYKWGMWEDDTINHFQDDDGHDVFVPIRKIEDDNDDNQKS